jgi:hypothetical protein
MADIQRLPGPNADEYEWQLHAACRGMDSSIFFHPADERVRPRPAAPKKPKRSAGNVRPSSNAGLTRCGRGSPTGSGAGSPRKNARKPSGSTPYGIRRQPHNEVVRNRPPPDWPQPLKIRVNRILLAGTTCAPAPVASTMVLIKRGHRGLRPGRRSVLEPPGAGCCTCGGRGFSEGAPPSRMDPPSPNFPPASASTNPAPKPTTAPGPSPPSPRAT